MICGGILNNRGIVSVQASPEFPAAFDFQFVITCQTSQGRAASALRQLSFTGHFLWFIHKTPQSRAAWALRQLSSAQHPGKWDLWELWDKWDKWDLWAPNHFDSL
jgi:hypothetical protein